MTDLSVGVTSQRCCQHGSLPGPPPSREMTCPEELPAAEWARARPSQWENLYTGAHRDVGRSSTLTYHHHLMKHVFLIPGECLVFPCQPVQHCRGCHSSLR